MTHSKEPGTDPWNPTQYERFNTERNQPFFDLMSLVERRPHMEVIDLGCGTGELTRQLHQELQASTTLGIDTSAKMLERSRDWQEPGLSFELKNLKYLTQERNFDLIFSNAAIQWVDHHTELLKSLAGKIRSQGQIAIQVPANHDSPSHTVAAQVAQRPRYREVLQDYYRKSPVLKPEEYSILLEKLGFERQQIRLQVYLHRLDSRTEVIEWVKGTLLTDYERRMPNDLFNHFLDDYREALFAELPDESPFLYPFKRILIWGAKK